MKDLAEKLATRQAMSAMDNQLDRRILQLILDKGTRPLTPGALSWLPASAVQTIDRMHAGDAKKWLEAILFYVNQRLADQGLYDRRFFYIDDKRGDQQAFVARLREKIPELRRVASGNVNSYSADEVSIETSWQRIYQRRNRGIEKKR